MVSNRKGRYFDDEQRKCAFGSCDARTLDRLRKERLRDRSWRRKIAIFLIPPPGVGLG
jgi:hypothetical protein